MRTATQSTAETLRFRRFTLDDIPMLMPRFQRLGWRTCDYTIGGIYMWADYFHYALCLHDDTLIINGVSERDVTIPAFSLPLGPSLPGAVDELRRLCDDNGSVLRFSAVPEEALPLLMELGPNQVIDLPEWADYLYDARALASLSGKCYNKKRNHLNRFLADNPGFSLEPLTPENTQEALAFMHTHPSRREQSVTAEYEHEQVINVLQHYAAFPFKGVMLKVPEKGVVAFTFGEVVGDTLHSHVEKIDHDVAGAGETVNCLFARHMLDLHPSITCINRQDDAGDPGLRQAKLSYHPVALLRKYDVVF